MAAELSTGSWSLKGSERVCTKQIEGEIFAHLATESGSTSVSAAKMNASGQEMLSSVAVEVRIGCLKPGLG